VTRLGPIAAVATLPAGVVTGCASGSHQLLSLGNGPTRSGLVRASFPAYELSFRYPVSWTRRDCRVITPESSSVTYLTSVHPVPGCSGRYPGWPRRLGNGGVFVWWNETSFPGATVDDSPGRSMRIGGQPAHVAFRSLPARAVRLVCARIGAQRSIVATIREPLRIGHNLFRVVACLRGPHFGPNESAVLRMLAGVRFASPR
jgi:hypothetical protein